MVSDRRLLQHVPRITTHWMNLARFKHMALVQFPKRRRSFHRSLVRDGLSKIFARRFQFRNFPQPVRGRIEFQSRRAGSVDQRLDRLVLNGNGRVFHESWIPKSRPHGQVFKIVPVQCARQTLAPQNFILLQFLWHATTGVDIGKVQFPTFFQESATGIQYGLFVRNLYLSTVCLLPKQWNYFLNVCK